MKTLLFLVLGLLSNAGVILAASVRVKSLPVEERLKSADLAFVGIAISDEKLPSPVHGVTRRARFRLVRTIIGTVERPEIDVYYLGLEPAPAVGERPKKTPQNRLKPKTRADKGKGPGATEKRRMENVLKAVKSPTQIRIVGDPNTSSEVHDGFSSSVDSRSEILVLAKRRGDIWTSNRQLDGYGRSNEERELEAKNALKK